MKNKKIVAGLLALTFVFGGAALPNTVVNNSVVASASESEYFKYGEFMCTMQEDGTVEILEYMGYDAKEVEIPAEINGVPVTSIGHCAFAAKDDDYFEKITSIVIPDSVKVINEGAFKGCDITSLVIPDSVEFIGHDAFNCCMNLESITLPENLKSIEDGTFENCNSLSSIEIPDSVESIGEDAFKSCHVLSSVTFSKNLKHIGKNAFRYCTCLRDIVIPDSVETIRDYAFANCDSSFDKNMGYYYNANLYSDIYSVTIPASVTCIGKNAFSDLSIASNDYKPAKKFIINCFKDSAAYWYALENGNNFEVIDAKDSKTKYPELIKEEYSPKFHKFRLNWTAVEGAEQYGIAVKLAGKWKVQAYIDADTTKYITPKLTSGQSYQAVICAKVNGKWDTSNINGINGRSFTLTVR